MILHSVYKPIVFLSARQILSQCCIVDLY